jgi:hypothetical protein
LALASIVSILALGSFARDSRAAQLGYWFETYSTGLSILDLGLADGVVLPYGGLCFKPGDPDTLLLAQQADSSACDIVSLSTLRDGLGHVVGFGAPAFFANAFGLAGGGLDGGLVVGPQDVLFYATFPDNTLGQIKPGSSEPDRLIDLSELGVEGTTGGVVVVPPQFEASGNLRLVGFAPGRWHRAHATPDGAGTFDVSVQSSTIELGGGPTSMLYVPATEQAFIDAYGYSSPHGYLLISKWSAGRIDSYFADEHGDPIISSELPFLENIDGAIGMTFDPISGDLVISTFQLSDRLVRVSGFAPPRPPCPADLGEDGEIGGADLGALLAAWGPCPNCQADLNGDGTVDGADLGSVLAAWGSCP